MAKFLGLKIPGGKKGLTYIGLGVVAIGAILYFEHKKGAGGHPMPPPRRHPMHAMPPMAHHPMPMARAHLANQIPVKGPPHGNALGVGGRLAGGYGSGNYMYGSGRIGVRGGGGIAGGYYAGAY